MMVSTKGRYAIRFLLDLATHSTGKPVRIKDVAARQEISEKYLEQVVSILTKAGYVHSVRGPQGGYLLAKEPAAYTMGMILRLTEGSLAPVACLESEENLCSRADNCVTLMFWEKLNGAIRDVMDGTTLADLVEWQQARDGDQYVI